MINKIKRGIFVAILFFARNKQLIKLTHFLYRLLGRTVFTKVFFNVIYVYWDKIAPFYREKSQNTKPKLMWGHVPIINNKYWSNALGDIGYKSDTLMNGFFNTINEKKDFDYYIDDIIKQYYGHFPALLIQNFKPFFVFDYVLKNYNILHLTCQGISLQNSPYNEAAIRVIKKFGIKTIVMPYGSDFQQYSRITHISFRHSLLINYPEAAKQEEVVAKDVNFWIKHADIFLSGVQVDAIGRWDLLPFNNVVVDTKTWHSRTNYSQSDGINEEVTIMHSPNHRGVKGTEFIVKAVDELKKEGYLINLLLVEKVQNSEVRRLMQEKADILASQLIYGVYALSAMEGMSSGIPVLTNLSYEPYTRVFRRYSYLNECPILSTTPENIKENLKILVTNPQLREELGRAGRAYAEKYHSYETAQYMFGKIYDKIWYGKDVDLMNMFHPLMPDSYNNSKPLVKHPLVENGLLPEHRAELLKNANQKINAHE